MGRLILDVKWKIKWATETRREYWQSVTKLRKTKYCMIVCVSGCESFLIPTKIKFLQKKKKKKKTGHAMHNININDTISISSLFSHTNTPLLLFSSLSAEKKEPWEKENQILSLTFTPQLHHHHPLPYPCPLTAHNLSLSLHAFKGSPLEPIKLWTSP